MSRYSLNLPTQLKQESEKWAGRQGVSLNQFIMWAVSEKVGALNQFLDDSQFPQITYRRGASGIPTPILRGTGLRVQTLVIAAQDWNLSPAQIAETYDLNLGQVQNALGFYETHRQEIDMTIASEQALEQAHA